MRPVIAFVLDMDQIKSVCEDLQGVLDHGEGKTVFLICDPNPPKFANAPDREVWKEGDNDPELMLAQIRQPSDLLMGSIYTLGFGNEPEEVLEKFGYKSIGDPDQN